uniref:Uncharacterized protein n=1 Tax=Kalanchoe fedtschenkoi TaxID=63787 RepID=A0A7N0US25_KALFE
MSILVPSLSSSYSSSPLPATSLSIPSTIFSRQFFCKTRRTSPPFSASKRRLKPLISAQLCAPETLILDKSKLSVGETVNEEELWAAACLRVRTFNDFRNL